MNAVKLPSITEQFGEADDVLFNRTLTNTRHVLQTYLPDRTETANNLRNHSFIHSFISLLPTNVKTHSPLYMTKTYYDYVTR